MNVNPLIFSNKINYRITRHALLWICWILYYAVFMSISWQSKFSFSKVFPEAIIEESLSIPMDMAFCYSVIYFLIPQFLRKGKYLMMVLLWLVFSILFVACFRFYTTHVIPVIRHAYDMPSSTHSMSFIWDFFNLFSQINMEGCFAAAIKLGKMWFIKQQEIDLLKQERRKTEHSTADAVMHPVFLMNALDRIEKLSTEKPALLPAMIGKIKKLLLYVIYDNNQPKVTLEKEMELLREYIELEQSGADQHVRVTMRLPSNSNDEKIAPFIILPLVENSFRQLAHFELADKFIDIEATVLADNFSICIAWSKPVDTSTLINGSSTFLNNINKRLDLLYPHSHKLKVVIKPDQFIIHLKIELNGAIN
jgi:two-component system sensor histidine kinase AlgZ